MGERHHVWIGPWSFSHGWWARPWRWSDDRPMRSGRHLFPPRFDAIFVGAIGRPT